MRVCAAPRVRRGPKVFPSKPGFATLVGMHARDYLSLGWSVLPLRPHSKLPDSNIIRRTRGTNSWLTYRDRHATPDEVADWPELEPEHNIGIVLGETSDNLVALDGDAEFPATVRIPATATVRTARGRHFYARTDAPIPTRRFSWGELRGEGTYICAPAGLVAADGRRPQAKSHRREGRSYRPGIGPFSEAEATQLALNEMRLLQPGAMGRGRQ